MSWNNPDHKFLQKIKDEIKDENRLIKSSGHSYSGSSTECINSGSVDINYDQEKIWMPSEYRFGTEWEVTKAEYERMDRIDEQSRQQQENRINEQYL